MDFVIKEKPSLEDINLVRDRLVEYNMDYLKPDYQKKFVIEARDENGELSGGIVFETTGNMLHLELLWVSADRRKKGLGSRLLKEAEDYAKRAGCADAYLTTFSFQARPFYEKHGYKMMYIQKNFHDGIVKYHMEKEL